MVFQITSEVITWFFAIVVPVVLVTAYLSRLSTKVGRLETDMKDLKNDIKDLTRRIDLHLLSIEAYEKISKEGEPKKT